jgi:hypothetical protein
MNQNKVAVFKVFSDADSSSANFTERLLELGIASRKEAKPLCMEWASAKHNEPTRMGNQGLTFKRRSTNAERAMNRVLSVCYPKADMPKPKKTTANKVDPVAQLFTKWQALSAAEKRRFTTMQLKA